MTSLAGATRSARRPVGELRVGGFGGVPGLVAYLTENGVRAVVDATHPYAAQMSAHAARACASAGVPLLRLDRPGWATTRADAAAWTWVDDAAQAVVAVREALETTTVHDCERGAAGASGPAPTHAGAPASGGTVFLAVGRNTLLDYAALADDPAVPVLARVADLPADLAFPADWDVFAARGPFGLAEERELFRARDVQVLVTKDSGGEATSAKLDAAAELGVRVVALRRPAPVPGVESVATVAEAAAWVEALG